jgi:acyl-CoA synthetase (AMP-forming)/AMP-acid ligase II
MLRHARDTPDAIAAVKGDRRLTYRELDERSSRLANLLQDRFGVERGDRVAMLLHNGIEVVVVLAACAKAGAVYCGLNPRLARQEYLDIFANAEPRVLITDSERAELVVELDPGLAVIDVDDGYEELLAASSPAPPAGVHDVKPEDDFAITYTSGTTGRPKGVHFDVRAVVQHATVAALEFEIDAQTRWLLALPHSSCLHITFLPLLLMGGAVVFMEQRGFDAERFAATVRRHSVTHTFLVPTMLFRLLESDVEPEAIPTLETIGYGSSPIPPERVRALVERYGAIFVQLYGMSEIASIGTMLRKADHARGVRDKPRLLASAGRSSYIVDIRIVDDERRDVPAGERGEVIFGTPYRLKGYYRDPERTAEALIDGWMHSGDIGHWDDEGYLYIVDRKKDMIITGGLNVLPSEIEAVLYHHPAVLEAAVFGLPDEEWGERAAAAVALKRDATVEPDELILFCKQAGLPTIKIPAAVYVLDALPKNTVGKIAKRAIRDRYAPA